jgi:uncharacterized membrane protein YfcA
MPFAGTDVVIVLAFFGLVGVLLGAFGGGGSLLVVPVLVHVAGLAPARAVAMSLVIVGVTSSIASLVHHRRHRVRIRTASMFALPSAIAALVGAKLTHLVSGEVLMLAFAALMLTVGSWMLRGARPTRTAPATGTRARLVPTVLAGAAIGALTGFLGTGGGFLVVPALVAFARLDMREAVRTSLLVIALNSVCGLIGHLGTAPVDLAVAAPLTAAAVAGALIGDRLSAGLPVDALRRGFAVLVVVVGALVAALTVLG